jgi:hypothetical protein
MHAPDSSLAEENARLRARIAELERMALTAPAGDVRYALDGRPLPTTSRRVFGRLLAFLLFLFGMALGFGLAMRNPDFRQGFQDGMRNPSPGAEVPPPSR